MLHMKQMQSRLLVPCYPMKVLLATLSLAEEVSTLKSQDLVDSATFPVCSVHAWNSVLVSPALATMHELPGSLASLTLATMHELPDTLKAKGSRYSGLT